MIPRRITLGLLLLLTLAGCKSDEEKRMALAAELNGSIERSKPTGGDWTGCKVGTIGETSLALSVTCVGVEKEYVARSVQPFLKEHCIDIERATFEGVIVKISGTPGLWASDVKTCELQWKTDEPVRVAE